MYRRYYRPQKPRVHTITVKYAGKCASCGATIEPGQIADYYPIGTIAGVHEARIAHVNSLNGNSVVCFNQRKKQSEDKSLNDYAGDGLDSRYEDQCKDTCGL